MRKAIKNKISEIVTGTDIKGQESVKKGEEGEERVSKILSSFGIPHLQNLYIPRQDGKGYTEVDILFVHKTGVYVLEVKNYKAKIQGDIETKKWRAKYRGGRVYPMYNPIRQNRGHKYGVEQEFGGKLKTKGLVIFAGGDVTLEIRGSLGKSEYIIYEEELLSVLQRELRGRVYYNKSEVEAIYRQLERYTGAGYLKKRKHIYNVKQGIKK